ncbi:hypothetical protein [Pyxidicoccus sp. MSG2]|uniref:hypothetical protein n=1 Tax=Pyxidicoccus sp. MSG2 TaxID=2996790 RepID=UPI00226EDF17|nr:hypothetical protein [Pyxidicoccus sp. MSG2]MCY1021615.1 hypothetical protein [Pyxidicoccus sp. MSG2]
MNAMPSAEKQRLIDRARAILLEQLRLHEARGRRKDEPRSSYDELDDAVRGALAGDVGTVTTLRRVFDEWGFAMTNSLNECGVASLGLALLGDRQSIQRIRGVSPINLNREAKPLALAILDAGESQDESPGSDLPED